MNIWQDEKGKIKSKYKFNYDFNLVSNFTNKMPHPADQYEFLSALRDTFNYDQTRRFSAKDNFVPNDKLSMEENAAAYEATMVVVRENHPKPHPGFAESLSAKLSALVAEIKSNGDHRPLEINIDQEYVMRLHSILVGYFTPENSNDLMSLLKGRKTGRKLVFLEDAEKLAGIFYSLKGTIINNPTDKLVDWIADSFQCTFNSKPKNYSRATMQKYFRSNANPSTDRLGSIEKLVKEFNGK